MNNMAAIYSLYHFPDAQALPGLYSLIMDRRKELGEFLRTKRAQTPVPSRLEALSGGRRRVAGLRREEVATLALISTIYYTKLEQGKVRGISSAVLDGLVQALGLSSEEREYITSLISVTGDGVTGDRDGFDDEVAPELARVVRALSGVPAHLLNDQCDLILANDIGRELYAWHFEDSDRPNIVRFQFLDPRARSFYVEWEKWAGQSVAYLRAAAARHPQDEELLSLVEDMRTLSPEFRELWDAHRVRIATRGVRRLIHPVVGPVDLEFQILRATGHPRLRLIAYTAPPGSPTERALERLAGVAHSSAS